jgi:hypothetical protein
MSFCSQLQNRNSTQKKVLKMSPEDARIVEEHASNNVTVMATLAEKTVLCLRRFVLLAVKKQQFRLNPAVTGQSIAGNVSRPEEATIDSLSGLLIRV